MSARKNEPSVRSTTSTGELTIEFEETMSVTQTATGVTISRTDGSPFYMGSPELEEADGGKEETKVTKKDGQPVSPQVKSVKIKLGH